MQLVPLPARVLPWFSRLALGIWVASSLPAAPAQQSVAQLPLTQQSGIQPLAPAATPTLSGQVTMMLFRVVKSDGQTCLLTPAGKLLPVPGKNIPSNITTVPIYRDADSNYWYINHSGQPVAISPSKVNWAVNYLQKEPGANRGMATPEAAPYPASASAYQPPVQQTTIVQQPQSGSSNSSGASMLGTGLAAAGGAMLGGMLGGAMDEPANTYYGMPYGTPLYHQDGRTFYYNNSGNKAYVAPHPQTSPLVNQWNDQGNWKDRQQWANASQMNRTEGRFGGNRRFR